jgi:hypothetical protein
MSKFERLVLTALIVLILSTTNLSDKNSILANIANLNSGNDTSDTSDNIEENTEKNDDDYTNKIVTVIIDAIKSSEDNTINSSENNSENNDNLDNATFENSTETTKTTVYNSYEYIETVVNVSTSTDKVETETETETSYEYDTTESVESTEETETETDTISNVKTITPVGFMGSSNQIVSLLPDGTLNINGVWYAEDVIDIGLDEDGAVVVQGGTVIKDIPYNWVILSDEEPPVQPEETGITTLTPTGFMSSSKHLVSRLDNGEIFVDGNLFAYNVEKIYLNTDESSENYGSIVCVGGFWIDSPPNWIVIDNK